MYTLVPIVSEEDILEDWRKTPIGDLLRYHNLGMPFAEYKQAQLLIGMCMDNRKSLRIPENFAFILRSGGANFRRSEFKISFAVAVGGVEALCLIGHTDCGMVGLSRRRDAFIKGLVDKAGWSHEEAKKTFDTYVSEYEISDAAEFVYQETLRLQTRYPKLVIAPLFYTVEDGKLHQIVKN